MLNHRQHASPLVVGLAPHAAFVASDVSAVLAHTRQFHFLEEGHLAVLRRGGRVHFEDVASGQHVEPSWQVVTWTPAMAEKDGHTRDVIGIGDEEEGLPLAQDAPPSPALAGRSLEWFDDLLRRARAHTTQVARGMVDADRTVHALYAGAAVPVVEAAFPGTSSDGIVDRDRLRDRVLGDEAAMATLEALIHPLVKREEERFLSEARAAGRRIVLLDIPLLFETRAEGEVDMVIVVSAP